MTPDSEDLERYFFGTAVKKTPERELLSAMIKQAICEYLFPQRWACHEEVWYIKASAKRWLFEPAQEPLREFSFPWVCQHLTPLYSHYDLRSYILSCLEVYEGNLKKRDGACSEELFKKAA